MRFLQSERRTLDALVPGLDRELAAVPLAVLESPDTPGTELFRRLGGAGLLLPKSHGGIGASALQAVRVQRALASRSPSLGVASTMHAFSLAALVEYARQAPESEPLLAQLGQGPFLLASGFAEGRSGEGILSAALRAEPVPGGHRLYGRKRPCSLSRSMDFLTASVSLALAGEGQSARGVAVVGAGAEGLSRRPFWRNPALAGAESDELVLDGVFVPDGLLFVLPASTSLERVELMGFIWFELLISATYLGVVSGLVERALDTKRKDAVERCQLAIELEGAMSALEGLARGFAEEDPAEHGLAPVLLVRFAVQQAIERAASRAAELLGGIAFVESSEVTLLLASARALAFHPPSRLSVAQSLSDHLDGGDFRL
jgi:alkylation response protein AidB-like acyl-CoA dehydrogenase